VAEFAAHVTTDIEQVSDEQLDDLVDALAPVAGVPSLLGGRLSVQLTLEAEGMRGALEQAVRAVGEAMAAAGVGMHVVGVEVLEQAEFDRRQGLPPQVEDLVSTTEAGEILGVSRQRILQLAEAYPDTFPRPVRLGARGLHWSAAALRRFDTIWDRSPGPRRKPVVDASWSPAGLAVEIGETEDPRTIDAGRREPHGSR
jgi:predicted DNA-binding transcriptional regulator AlpA